MLVVGLGGFGVTNFGGSLTSIGKVGDRSLTVTDYAHSLQQEVAAFSQRVRPAGHHAAGHILSGWTNRPCRA